MVEIRMYRTVQGRVPFDEWFSALHDRRAQKRVQLRIDRLALGLEGDWRPIVREFGSFVFPKARDIGCITHGTATPLVLLLYGGNKSTQSRDIVKAREYWRDYHGQ